MTDLDRAAQREAARIRRMLQDRLGLPREQADDELLAGDTYQLELADQAMLAVPQ